MSRQRLTPQFLEKLKLVTGKRSRIVVDHILEHGFIVIVHLPLSFDTAANCRSLLNRRGG